MDIQTEYAKFATEFLFLFPFEEGPHTISITRRTNHGRLIEDGGWMVLFVAGPWNPWYLGDDGRWRYKSGVAFPSHEAAFDALTRAESPEASYVAQSSETSQAQGAG